MSPSTGVRRWLACVHQRQPALARFAIASMLLGIAAFAGAVLDDRRIGGAPAWLKPAKFFWSVGLFALTSAWYIGLVHPARRQSRTIRAAVWTIIVTGSFELAYIALQAARGQVSHWNTTSPMYATLYAAMGLAAVALIGTNVALAWEIARRPLPGSDAVYRWAVVVGLVLTAVLGGVTGMYMGAQTGHAVGPEGNGLLLLGWNGLGGDLRVAHFLGMHAEQALPLLAWASTGAATRWRTTIVITAATTWAVVTAATLAQAIGGHPFF